jgi:hypothetical protein
VQSDTRNTFSQAKQDLENGVLVLYTGTPCQIAGLKAFLQKEYANLLTADLVCHGVPSPDFFEKYISWLQHKINGEIITYNFRDKTEQGWDCYGRILYKKGNEKIFRNISPVFDPYYSLFLKGDIYRQCCYECKYSNSQREGDFTIGDFWGIENVCPELPSQNGVSLLMVNNAKAQNIFDRISANLVFVETTLEKASEENNQLKHPSLKSKRREHLLKEARKGSFQKVVILWFWYNRKELIYMKLKSFVPERIKEMLKKFCRVKQTNKI